ncbi:MAG: 4'-phosphopantetheinyl transferase superfamily protein [Planctomycetales bacterium]
MNQCPRMPADTIDVWYACVDTLIASDSIAGHYKVLNESEKAQIARFSLPRVQEESLAARLLMRHALSFYADVTPERWQFEKGQRGKPFVVAPWNDFHAFNLTHSANLVVFAIAPEGHLGVDVESLDRSTTGIPLARRFFASQEVEQLLALPSALRRESFLQIWTLKEAYIKAVGDGLAIPLDQFFFDLTQPGPAELHLNDVSQSGSDWLFAQLRLPSRHHISLGITSRTTAEREKKKQIIVRARELKSTHETVPNATVVCSEKNAWFFKPESE